jgi:Ca2+-binding EF-hand superfamily protein
LLYASNQVAERVKGKGGHDFAKSIQIERQVAKLQARFRGHLARKKLEEDAGLQEKKLAVQEKRSTAPKEELALQEFKQRLQQKAGLTPEAFFRCCDSGYQKSISCDHFKAQVSQLNLRLSRAQISRLVLILDEDLEGNITLEEYQDALEAYNCSGEKHSALDGSSSYLVFEHKALFKLVRILQERRMSHAELFRSCDVNGDGQVNLKELEQFLTGFSPEFRQKDVHAIHTFFDLDKNGLCDEKEFLTQIKKAEKQNDAFQKRSSTDSKPRPGTA